MAITINDNSTRKQYSASSGQTDFVGTWRIEAAAEIKVYQTLAGVAPDDTTDILVLTTDYTVTGVGVGNSFTVTLNVGAATNDVITIVADIDFSANYNFLTNQDFDPDDFNEIFSKFDRELKQLRMETRKLQVKYQNSEQVIAKDYKLPQLAARQSWRMDQTNTEIEAVVIGDVLPGETWYAVTTGVNTYLATITDFVGYTTGEKIHLNFGSSNTSTSTININSLGAKNLVNSNGIALVSGDLVAGVTYSFLYHDNEYYLLGLGQKATQAEVETGTDNFKYVTPATLKGHSGNVYYVATAGAANTYTGTITGIATYVAGLTLEALINVTNTGASTININGLGAKTISRPDGNALTAGDLQANQVYVLIYVAGQFLLVGAQQATDSLKGITDTAGIAKVWARFKWTGAAVQIDDSYGVSSITRSAGGRFTVNFSETFASTNYCVSGSGHGAVSGAGVTFDNPLVLTTTSADILFFNYINGALEDPTIYGCVIIHGKLA
jgi:hypothetical protein